MTRHKVNYILLLIFLTAFCLPKMQAQLIVTGLVDDPERNVHKGAPQNSALKIAASSYTDTLRLPFFEDFSDVVVPIDSIVIDNSTDSIVRIYNKVLNAFPDTTLFCVGFTNPLISTEAGLIAKNVWYIKKISTNEFLIDSSNTLTTPMKIDVTARLYNAFWRRVERVYSTSIDTLKWLPEGNTYINNRYPLSPVSYNVATFDGLKADGTPYNTVNVLERGFSDHLTSLPINLESYSAGDNIYFSYFWQHSGIGDAPESDDYIQLEFKDNTGTWNIIKTIAGDLAYMDTFQIEIVAVDNPSYFFRHFQFRFRSFGRLSGPFDLWHIDHIYLDRNRNATDTIFNDKSIGNIPVTFLNRYTAMPYNQFFANKAAESGAMPFSNNNLGRGIPSQEFFYSIADYTVHPDLVVFSRDTAASHFPDHLDPSGDNERTFYDVCAPDVSTLNNYGHPIYIDQTFRIPANDTVNILWANNNKFATKTILWDYYAYDDGSPEGGIGGNQTGSKMANKFTINLSDTLTDIDIYFTRSKGPNMNGRTILLSVWDHNKNLVSQQPVAVGYGGFKRYKLNTPVIVPAGSDYYVGYQQNFGDLLSIGYDKNYDRSDMIYYSLSGSEWNAYNQQPGFVTGSMMVRPVFNKNEILITPVQPKENEPMEVVLYPVPTQDILKIKGVISDIVLYDFTGRQVYARSFDLYAENKEIDIAFLPDGMYLAELKRKDQSIIKKIIVQHGF